MGAIWCGASVVVDGAAVIHDRFPAAGLREPDVALVTYQEFAHDFVRLLEEMRSTLEADVQDRDDVAAVDAAVEDTFRRFEPTWRNFMDRSFEVIEPLLLGKEEVARLHRWTAEHVVPHLAQPGTILERAYVKPRGYPGDFGVMEFAYEGRLVGETPYARLGHRLGLDIARPVVSRLDVAVRDVAAQVETGGRRHLRFLDVGSGSAPEIPRIAALAEGLERIDAVLVDHDSGALDAARERIDAMASSSSVEVSPRYVASSYATLVRPPSADEERTYDYIYCIGLIDYLSDRRALDLVRGLWARLAEGGTLLVGNMKAGTANVWPVNVMFDWRVKYRTAEDLHGWADAVGPRAVELRLDESGHNFLLFLRK